MASVAPAQPTAQPPAEPPVPPAPSPGQLAQARSARRARRLGTVVAANLVVAGAEVAGGLLGHSMALLADAGHNATDVAAVALALVALRLARRPPTTAKSFGYHRSGVLAAQANAAGVLVASVLIGFGAVERLLHPVADRVGIVAGTAGLALALNLASTLLLAERSQRDLNLRATVLHMAGDAASSGGVLVAGMAIWLDRGLGWLDPAVALAVALLVGWQALRLARQVVDVLLEGTPAETDTAELQRLVRKVPGVEDMHDLHVWSLSAELKLASAHLVMAGHPSLETAQAVAERVRSVLAREFGVAHATLELECETCTEGATDPCAMSN